MPNNDYILRSDALEEVRYIPVNMDDEVDVEAAEQLINAIPAADVVPVVRCADCQYYEKRCPSEDIGWCNRPGAGCGQPKEFYCAGGVRQDGGSVSG